ncbi:uncharacterized protein LOC143348400 [Colletes latitarsis]|uniref:uncharacterized protein LOC143348400 n=1 Tax=Colletes latitarsis TaxID=2605962 RepID=UPI0040372C41
MDDSFLEDLELVSKDVKNVNSYALDGHITTRTVTSIPVQNLVPHSGKVLQHRTEQYKLTEKQSGTKELNVNDMKKLLEQDTRNQQTKVKVFEKTEIPSESKLKPIENKVKTSDKELTITNNTKAKIRETKTKISESKVVAKDRIRRSGSSKVDNQSPSVKENSRPTDCVKESTSQMEICKDRGKSNGSVKKLDSKENDPVALLNAIKDIVSICTKQECSNILRVMQELHINSQANLIKHLLNQTDEIINEIHPSKDSNRIKNLIEQNDRLKEEIVILQKRNEDLQRKLEFLKQEYTH